MDPTGKSNFRPADRSTHGTFVRLAVGLLLVAAMLGVVFSATGTAAATDETTELHGVTSSLIRKAQLDALPVRFSQGMDAIGRLDFADGVAIFGELYTDDVKTDITFPDGTNFVLEGPDAFAGFVQQFFGDEGYVVTQHLVGSVDSSLENGRKATVDWQLHATHVRPDGTVDIGNGAWTATATRSRGVWRIDSQTMQVLSFGPRDDTTRDEIEDLITSGFARAMDKIGDVDLEGGKALFAETLTDDIAVAMTFPDGSIVETSGIDELAEFVDGFFRSNGYVTTQHGVVNIDIDVVPGDPTKADIRFEFIASHHRPNPDAGTIDIDLGNGRWVGEAVLTEDGWKISDLNLTILRFGEI